MAIVEGLYVVLKKYKYSCAQPERMEKQYKRYQSQPTSSFKSLRPSEVPLLPTSQHVFCSHSPDHEGPLSRDQGPDTTSLPIGQLVLLEPFIRARDDPDTWIFWGAMEGSSEGSKKLFAENWRYATFSEYAKAPLEVTWALNENRLCKELGYTIPELVQLSVDVVAYSGLKGIGLTAGERIIVTPATGIFSGAPVKPRTTIPAAFPALAPWMLSSK